MRGEELTEVQITSHGLLGDRAYALIDTETGKVVSAKSVRQFPNILDCRAEFLEPPQIGCELPHVRIDLPNGATINSDSTDVDAHLSDFFKRNVALARVAPDDFTIDMYHPDIEGAVPAAQRNTFVDQKLGAAYFAQAGLPSPVPGGSFFDLFPLTVITTSTLRHLSELRPESRFDQHRFRMNVLVDTEENGFVENDWVSRVFAIGNDLRIRVVVPDSRCVMTTLAQAELPKDSDILRTLARYNLVQVADAGKFPCAGVYAVVEAAGVVKVSDQVRSEM
jgi:hypothetical protein